MELEGKKISVCFCASSIDILLIVLHAIFVWFIDNHEVDVMLEFLYYAPIQKQHLKAIIALIFIVMCMFTNMKMIDLTKYSQPQ